MAAAKRKRDQAEVRPVKRQASTRATNASAVTNPDVSIDIFDAPNALRATPEGDMNSKLVPRPVKQEQSTRSESPLSDVPRIIDEVVAKSNGAKIKREGTSGIEKASSDDKAPIVQKNADDGATDDPEAEGEEEAGEEEIKEALARPPPVHSNFLPLPWKGRLGYACLNTYLRQSNPPVFSSRTCRIQSILEHRHPLQDPNQPEHPTKNRPDRTKPADIKLGQQYLESICLANVKDIARMIRWNDRYNIKFMRLSSEMFPFASHPEYGYDLASFASEALAEAGRVIAQYGHRVTTHPGQFTQLGSPRRSVIDNAIRDLQYHDELLTLLKLPEQLNRDAVMILHMGGMFEGKQETLQRFREEYVKLSPSIRNRLVLENDDVGWSVHDLLPVCEELNIPMVLDYHHHNIVFDATQLREGTRDIMDLYPRIKATWDRKNITQKMHYSEPTPPAITPRQRRKHSPRVATLPPCARDMDLMIEAKDKEQAVFELMRTFKLPGYDTFNDIIPYVRNDDNKATLATLNKKPSNKAQKEEQPEVTLVPDDDVGMGGPDGRVYWPPGMEEWLRPKKREVKKKEPAKGKTKAQLQEEAAAMYAAREAKKAKENGAHPASGEDSESAPDATPATKKAKAAMRKKDQARRAAAELAQAQQAAVESAPAASVSKTSRAAAKPKARASAKRKTPVKEEPAVLTPSSSEEPEEEMSLNDDEDESVAAPTNGTSRPKKPSRQPSRRKTTSRPSYAEHDEDEDEQ